MRFTFAATLFALASSVVGAPLSPQANRYAGLARIDSSLEKRYCSQMPSKPDMNMVKIVYQTVLKRSKDPKVMLITFITAYRESMFNNLNCGDKNSLGLFQQQFNMGWGTKEQIRDPVYSTNKFLDVLLGLYPANKNKGAGILAQMVQNAEAGEKYTENIPKGNELIAAAKKMVGDSGDDEPATTTKSSGGNGGAINVGGKPTPKPSQPTNTKNQDGPKQTAAPAPAPEDKTDDDEEDCECTKYYVPVRGDICSKVANRFNLKLDEFYELNPQIDAHCQNLYAGQKYCVSTDPADAADN